MTLEQEVATAVNEYIESLLRKIAELQAQLEWMRQRGRLDEP